MHLFFCFLRNTAETNKNNSKQIYKQTNEQMNEQMNEKKKKRHTGSSNVSVFVITISRAASMTMCVGGMGNEEPSKSGVNAASGRRGHVAAKATAAVVVIVGLLLSEHVPTPAISPHTTYANVCAYN